MVVSSRSTAARRVALESAYVPLVQPFDVPKLLKTSRIVIFRVGIGTPDFQDGVRAFFAAKYPGQIAFGRVQRETIDMTSSLVGPIVAAWVQERNRQLGLQPTTVVRDGYYLFVDGEISGYHPGIWELKEDKERLLAGFAALLVGVLLESGELARLASDTVSFGAAQRVISFFDECIADLAREQARRAFSAFAETARQRQRAIEEQELARAYRLLGLPASASDDELRLAFRRLTKLHHPDRHAHNPRAFADANNKFRGIMEAYELIRNRRGTR